MLVIMGLPVNGDAVIKECVNCQNEFEEIQSLGKWITCNEDDGGCGFKFKLSANKGSLETD